MSELDAPDAPIREAREKLLTALAHMPLSLPPLQDDPADADDEPRGIWDGVHSAYERMKEMADNMQPVVPRERVISRDEPEAELVIPAGKLRLASAIRVDRDENGAPRITIDGEVFPFFTAGIQTPPPSLHETPTVTITIPADKIEMVNELRSN